MPFAVEDWGLIDYQQAVSKQLALVDQVFASGAQGTLVFCSHPPVVTLGRKTQEGDVFAWKGPLIEVSRGGRATYHGPSQLVIYPVVNLAKRRDLGWYLTQLGLAIEAALAEFGIRSQAKALSQGGEDTGVWVGNSPLEKKIASLGIAVKNWVTYHGAALNVDEDAEAFVGMKPCGFEKSIMTSVQAQTGVKPDRKALQQAIAKQLQTHLS